MGRGPISSQRFRALLLFAATVLLVALALGLREVSRQLSERMAAELAAQRVHLERVGAVERLARRTHLEMVERWLQPFAERARRSRDLEAAVSSVRAAADDFARLPPLDEGERDVTQRLLVHVAIWSNRVSQAVVAADGPAATDELRRYLDEIGRDADQLIGLIARAGSSTDRELERLRGRQQSIEVVFVLATLAVLGLAIVWARRKAHADERYRLAESARLDQQREVLEWARSFSTRSSQLREPLEAIFGVAVELRERSGLEPGVREAAARIGKQAQELLGIVEHLLEAARLEEDERPLDREPISLGEVFERSLQRTAGLIGKKPIEIACESEPGLPRVIGDPLRLQQVFSSLIASAIQSTARGRITVSAVVDGKQVRAEVRAEAGGAAFAVWLEAAQALERIAS